MGTLKNLSDSGFLALEPSVGGVFNMYKLLLSSFFMHSLRINIHL